MEETRARHRSIEEYRRDLVITVNTLERKKKTLEEEIKQTKRAIDGLSTMIANKKKAKEKIEEEIDKIARLFGEEGADTEKLAKEMAKLRKQLEDIDKIIEDKESKLQIAEMIYAKLKEQKEIELAELERKADTQRAKYQKLVGDEKAVIQLTNEHNFFKGYISSLKSAFEEARPHLTSEDKSRLIDSGFMALHDAEINGQDSAIYHIATYLFFEYINEATNYVNDCGGNTQPLSDWRGRKDEEDDLWWRKNIQYAVNCMKLRIRKSRGR